MLKSFKPFHPHARHLTPSGRCVLVSLNAALLALAVACGSSSSDETNSPGDDAGGTPRNDAGGDANNTPRDDAGNASDSGPSHPTVIGATVVAGGSHTCALLDDLSIKCWGANGHGELGLGDNQRRGDQPNQMGDNLPTVNLGSGRAPIAIAAGLNHTCALLDDHAVKCWGFNSNGQLGLDDNKERGSQPNQMGDKLPAINLGSGRSPIAIAAGLNHTCALLDDHSIKCWGANYDGQLGLDDNKERGSQPNQMGDKLPAIKLGSGRFAIAIAAGANHTCALLDDHSLKCWGANETGALGLGDNQRHGDQPNEMGDNLPTVKLGSGRSAIAITAGNAHTCALLDDHSIKCWGESETGAIGLGEAKWQGDQPNEMGDSLPSVSLGSGRSAIAIAAGAFHTCALLDDHSIKCWGTNSSGQLGLGDNNERGSQPNQMGDSLPSVSLGTGRSAIAIVTGSAHTCALLDDRSLKCWGAKGGRLGLGDDNERGSQPNQMGDNLPSVNLGSGRTVH